VADRRARSRHRAGGSGILGLLIVDPKALRLSDLTVHPDGSMTVNSDLGGTTIRATLPARLVGRPFQEALSDASISRCSSANEVGASIGQASGRCARGEIRSCEPTGTAERRSPDWCAPARSVAGSRFLARCVSGVSSQIRGISSSPDSPHLRVTVPTRTPSATGFSRNGAWGLRRRRSCVRRLRPPT
jgi:hypothetical protein